MSTTENLTFESVNEHVEKHYTAALAGAKPAAASLCSVYGTVKPILKLAIKILPKKWGSALETLMAVLDTMCPSQQA